MSGKMTVLEKERKLSTVQGSEWPQILAVLIGSLSAMSSGFHVAWTSPFLVKITNDPLYDINESEASYFTFLNTVAIVILCPLISVTKIVDTFGRKKVLLSSAIPHAVALLIEAFSRNLYVLYAARLTAGIGDALYIASLPIYIGEVTTPKVRGIWGNSLICMLFLGQLLMNVIGAYCSMQQTSFICVTVQVTFLVLFAFMPETPYFYILKARDGEAKKSLRMLRGKEDVEDEFQSMKAAVQRQMSESGKWRDLFTIASNRNALTAALFLRISQLFCGFYVFASYTQFIFKESGGNIAPEVASIIYIGLSFILFSASAFFSDKLGRKKAYIISLSLSSSMLLLEGIYFYIKENHSEIDINSLRWIPLTGMLTFIVFCALGVATIPTLMLGELFSASVKVKCVIIVTTAFALGVSFTNYIFYFITSFTGLCGPFILFGCCSILAAVLTNYIVPETRGKTLEEIQMALKGQSTGDELKGIQMTVKNKSDCDKLDNEPVV
ncbi:hypothetical protein JTB14_016788 [Gonioctena quinquepunctata]|nr:hypothetical protein JTB14_016788 [Gonioctena quinquepunctata]